MSAHREKEWKTEGSLLLAEFINRCVSDRPDTVGSLMAIPCMPQLGKIFLQVDINHVPCPCFIRHPTDFPSKVTGFVVVVVLVYMDVYMSVCMYHWVHIPTESRRRHCILLSCNYRFVVSHQHGCWELNSSPLREQQVLFPVEPCPQPKSIGFCWPRAK